MTRQRIVQISSIALAVVLLWLALRGVDFARVWSDLRAAQWWWLAPMVVATLAAHWLRGWRWALFLNVLPPESSEPEGPSSLPVAEHVPVHSAFGALMVGYMANYAAPRLGEFVRTANIAARTRLKFAPVLGTVAVERILDMVTLGAAMLTLPLVLGDRLGAMRDLVSGSASAWGSVLVDQWPLFTVVAIVLLLGSAVVLRRVSRLGNGRFRRILRSFGDGLKSLQRTPQRSLLVGTTVLMWLCYGIMAYMPFLMFGYDHAFGVTFLHAWGLMLIGALGIVVPSPGGIGSYHFITIQALVLMFAFPASEAATYAIVSHAGQLVLYVVVGFTVLVMQGFSLPDLVPGKTDA